MVEAGASCPLLGPPWFNWCFKFVPVFSKLFCKKESPSSGSISVSPRCLIHQLVIMIYLCVIHDSLTSKRFTTRNEQLTICCEPLKRVMVRLGHCKTGLRPPVI